MHGMALNLNPGNLEAANAAQRSTNTQQAAAVRKKLSSTSAHLEDDASFESLILLGNAHSEQHKRHSSNSATAEQNDSAEDPENANEPDPDNHRSYWA